MSEPLGLREAHRQATKKALRDAAKRLFADHGYEGTTVRQIADAANVTERTFYRYYDGKQDLLAEEALAWIDVLHGAIRGRPSPEPPFVAVRRAMLDVAGQGAADLGPARFWLFTDQPQPFALLGRATPRPLLRVEQSVAAALLERLDPEDGDEAPPTYPAEFEAQLLARIAVAALRSAAIRHRQLEARADTDSPGVEQLLQDAFAMLADLAG
jgi:AcrR family transcriptional regulator